MISSAYTDRVIAFVDILGFGQLVERSSQVPSLVKEISSALSVVDPTTVQTMTGGTINRNVIPKEELREAELHWREFSSAIVKMSELEISFFSDSLVLSAPTQNRLGCQTVIDLIGRLQIEFWNRHQLLLRGGIAMGQLVHVKGGQLFGPAMNRAYHLESKIAVYPRVVIDEPCWSQMMAAGQFEPYQSYFSTDADGIRAMSLAECFKHSIEDSALVATTVGARDGLLNSLKTAPKNLKKLRDSFDEPRVVQKYEWLIPRVGLVRAGYFPR